VSRIRSRELITRYPPSTTLRHRTSARAPVQLTGPSCARQR